jgi:hypothetical protein
MRMLMNKSTVNLIERYVENVEKCPVSISMITYSLEGCHIKYIIKGVTKQMAITDEIMMDLQSSFVVDTNIQVIPSILMTENV